MSKVSNSKAFLVGTANLLAVLAVAGFLSYAYFGAELTNSKAVSQETIPKDNPSLFTSQHFMRRHGIPSKVDMVLVNHDNTRRLMMGKKKKKKKSNKKGSGKGKSKGYYYYDPCVTLHPTPAPFKSKGKGGGKMMKRRELMMSSKGSSKSGKGHYVFWHASPAPVRCQGSSMFFCVFAAERPLTLL